LAMQEREACEGVENGGFCENHDGAWTFVEARAIISRMNSVQPFLIRWLFTTIAVAVAAQLTGMTYDNLWSLAGAALLLGFVNAFVRPVLLLLGLPFII